MLGPLRWVLLYVSDLPRMVDFYAMTFGLEPAQETDRFALFKTGECTFELMGKFDNGPETMGDARGWDRNKLLISFKVEDIHAVVDELNGRGLQPLGGIRPTVSPECDTTCGWLAQFMDPEGNIFEICQEPSEAPAG